MCMCMYGIFGREITIYIRSYTVHICIHIYTVLSNPSYDRLAKACNLPLQPPPCTKATSAHHLAIQT